VTTLQRGYAPPSGDGTIAASTIIIGSGGLGGRRGG
jgi:hypothetical protein